MRRICFVILIVIFSLKGNSQRRYVGSGIVFAQQPVGKYYPLDDVYLNSPAAAAGLKKGDIIYSIDGISTEGKAISEMSALIKGDAGTARVFTVGANRKTVQLILKLIKGKCISGNCENGDGKLLDIDSSIYTGHFENGKLTGKGKWEPPKSREVKSYEGNWMGDAITGTGIVRYKNGDIFTMNYANGKRTQGDMKLQFKDGGYFIGKTRSDNKIAGTCYSPAKVIIGNKEEEFNTITEVVKYYKMGPAANTSYIKAKDDQGYIELKSFIDILQGSLEGCAKLMSTLTVNTNYMLSKSREYYLGRRYRGDLIDYLEIAGQKLVDNKYSLQLINSNISFVDSKRTGIKLGFKISQGLMNSITDYLEFCNNSLQMYKGVAPNVHEIGRMQYDFIKKIAEDDKKSGERTLLKDDRNMRESIADYPQVNKYVIQMSNDATEGLNMYLQLRSAFKELDETRVEKAKAPVAKNTESENDAKKPPVSVFSSSIKRDKPRKFSRFESNSRTSGTLYYGSGFARLLSEKEGYSKDVIERIAQLLDRVPKNVTDAQAEKWKAYEIVNNGIFYLAWVPKDENLHIEGKFQPADADGFFVFMVNY